MKKAGYTSEFRFGIYWWTFKNLKNENFEKNEKNCWRYHHFIDMYQKLQSYEVQFLRYGVRQFFFSFWAIFLPFTTPYAPPPHLTSQKTKYLKKWKKNLELSSFCATKNMIKWSMFTQILSVTNIIFALLPHYWPQKLKFGENVKSTWRYYPLTHVHHKSRSHDEWLMRYKLQRPKILSFWAIFFSLIFLKTQKIKILKI